MPKKTSIKYDPTLSVEEMAVQSGCTVNAVRKYIQVKGIDRAYDLSLIRYNKVQVYKRKHPDASPSDAARDQSLGLSLNTIKKYWDNKPPKTSKTKISTVDKTANKALMMTVSNRESVILNSILTLYLDNAPTFDCDLTIGKGSFYKSIPRPKYCYDKFPQSPDVTDIQVIFNEPIELFRSVVVDLPQYVSEKQRENYNSFNSLEEAYSTHLEILDIAYKILFNGGILVYKTTDFILEGEQQWLSDFVLRRAEGLGFKLIDKFIYVVERKLMRRHSNQSCATKTHAFFFVFRKRPTIDIEDLL